MFMKTSTKIKDLFDFSNYRKDSKYDKNSNNLIVDKMKDTIGGVKNVLQD